MERQESKELSFCIVFMKIKSHFQEKAKYSIFGPFWENLGKNEFFTKIGYHHFLASTNS